MKLRWIGTALMATVAMGQAQNAAKTPLQFEVASVKLNRSGAAEGCRFDTPPGGQRFTMTNCPLGSLISFAYGVGPALMSGGPMPVLVEKYDISAKAEYSSSRDQIKEMIRGLLQTRFALNVHLEPKLTEVYHLVVTKGGPKFKPAQDSGGRGPGGGPVGGNLGDLRLTNVSMAAFATAMSNRLVSRTVIDRTGLTETYDFELIFTPELFGPQQSNRPDDGSSGAAMGSARPDIFEALRSELGLQLESRKETVDHLVIDHAERPSEN
ncbi:MAG TPA: TIGR03435 family protein [Bryobacteraceae bacterium]|jgi:uncharacterized protein (TIGR03435 family)|nr:TIGR03435 family protein [Bryobacteraceae bacterium]